MKLKLKIKYRKNYRRFMLKGGRAMLKCWKAMLRHEWDGATVVIPRPQ